MFYANWIFFLGDKENKYKIFVYGLSLPTNKKEKYVSKLQKLCKIDNYNLYMLCAITEINNIIQDNTINLSIISDELPQIKYLCSKKFIQPADPGEALSYIKSPINSLTNITSYYTKEILTKEFLNEDLIILLKQLNDILNQRFYGEYSKRLGCFEIGEIQTWAEDIIPFYFKFDKNNNDYIFHKRNDFKEDLYIVLKCYLSDNEKIYENIKFVSKTDNDIQFNGIKEHWIYEASIYNNTGNLIHEEKYFYTKRIWLNICPKPSNKIKIEDVYSEKDANLRTVDSAIFTTQSIVNNPYIDIKYDEIEKLHKNIEQRINNYKISEKEGAFFSEKDKLNSIINYLNSINLKNDKIIIIDPYIDIDSLSLGLRLHSSELLVISSKNPPHMPKSSIKQNIQNILKVKKENNINSIKVHFIEKRFHDRFIIFFNNHEKDIYSISNSVNSLKTNPNILITKLNGKVRFDVEKYLDTLIELCKPENTVEEILKNDK